MSKNFDETVRFQSEKRQEWIREMRGKRLQGIAEGASSTPRLARSSAGSFPWRNDCPGTHCSLIEQEEKTVPARSATEFEIKGKMEERAARESDRRRRKISNRLVGAAETCKALAEWRRLQRKNLNKLGLLKRKKLPQCHRESSWQVCGNRHCQKEKEQSRLFRVPDHEGERLKGGESPTLARDRGGSEREHGEERVDSTVSEGRFQGRKREQATRASLREV